MESLKSVNLKNHILTQITRFWQIVVDRTTLFPTIRWAFLASLLAYSLYRIFKYHCLTVICIFAFYTIYLTLQFFTPAGSASLLVTQEDHHLEETNLIIGQPQTDRPILRALNELNLWKQMLGLTLLSLLSTTFELFTLPISKPFLIGYLIWLLWLAINKHHKMSTVLGFNLSNFLSPKPLNPPLNNPL